MLLAADGVANQLIAERVGVSRPTVNLWRARYAESGLGGLVGHRPAGLGEDRRLTLQLALIEAILEDEDVTAQQLREGAQHMKDLTGAGLLLEWLGLRRSRLGIKIRD